MKKQVSIAEQIKFILSHSKRPLTIGEISAILGGDYKTSYVRAVMDRDIKKGIIAVEKKETTILQDSFVISL